MLECRHAPLYLWYTLTRKGYQGMRKDVETCFRNAHILKAGCFVSLSLYSLYHKYNGTTVAAT